MHLPKDCCKYSYGVAIGRCSPHLNAVFSIEHQWNNYNKICTRWRFADCRSAVLVKKNFHGERLDWVGRSLKAMGLVDLLRERAGLVKCLVVSEQDW